MNKPILFEDYYNITATTHNENPALMIPIGINDQGVLDQVEITEKHWQHILVAGHAGSGKSTYLHTVLGSLLLNYTTEQVNIWLSDGGMCEFNRFADTTPAHIKRVNTSCENYEYVAFTEALATEVENRLTLLATAEKTSFYSFCYEAGKNPFPRLVVMLDGFDHFIQSLAEAGNHYISMLEGVIHRASVCGITLIISTQEAISLMRHVPESIFMLFGIRVATKQSSISYDLLFESNATELGRQLVLVVPKTTPGCAGGQKIASSEE